MKQYFVGASFLFSILVLASCGSSNDVSCLDEFNCADGQICSQTGQCIPTGTCLVHNDCDPDTSETICNASGACVAGTPCSVNPPACAAGTYCSMELATDICIPDGTCLGHDDCPDGQNCGNTNQCATPSGCTTSDDCANGFFCASNDMCLPEGQCVNSDDCSNEKECTAGACVDRESCEDNASACDDNGGEYCSAVDPAYCIPDAECRANADCLETDCGTAGHPACETCNNRTCGSAETVCSTSAQCGENFFCDFGEDNEPPGTCKFDTRCGNAGRPPLSKTTNLLIVLDRTGTMKGTINQGADSVLCGDNRKWSYAIDALVPFLATLGDDSKVGMIPFADPTWAAQGGSNACEMDNPYILRSSTGEAIEMPLFVDEGNASVLRDLLQRSCADNEGGANNYYCFGGPGLEDDGICTGGPDITNDNLYNDGPQQSPTGPAFVQAAEDPFFAGADTGGNILLISDGTIGNCPGASGVCFLAQDLALPPSQRPGECDENGVITNLRDDHGVHTYVIGFGDRTKIQKPNLNAMAIAGGKPLDGTDKFYLAENGLELIDQLISIGNDISSCTYTFQSDTMPITTGNDAIHVFIGTELQSQEANNGWTLTWDDNTDTASITFHGSSCTLVKSTSAEVAVFLGCGLG